MSRAAQAEEWFAEHGLPWFDERVDARVAELLTPRRLLPLAAIVVLAGAAGVVGVLRWDGDASTASLVGMLVAVLVVLLYAGGPLRVATMARWAAGRVLRELGLLLPLVTRALPLLLLFMISLFVNTEVWQVGASLTRTRLWAVVWLFVLVGIAFLLTRLPQEVGRVEGAARREGVPRACADTPFADVAAELRAAGRLDGPAPLSPTQRANLVLVLLVAQAFQVLLLVLAVFVFFLGFGALAIPDDVVQSWIGHAQTSIQLWGVSLALPIRNELFQVAVFLSAFAGLYFTVYAVSDSGYREQFFAELDDELRRAVGVRAVYLDLLTAEGTEADHVAEQRPHGEPDSAGENLH